MGWTRPLSPLIQAVGKGEAQLHLGDDPAVGLVVFGFDAGQRDETRWIAHRSKLEINIGRTTYVGDPAKVRL